MPKPKIPIVLAVPLALALASGFAGCGAKSTTIPASEGASKGSSGEAAKTQALEQKADDYQARMQAIQSSDMSADEKAQAAGALVDEQQQTIQQAVDAPAADPNAPPPN